MMVMLKSLQHSHCRRTYLLVRQLELQTYVAYIVMPQLVQLQSALQSTHLQKYSIQQYSAVYYTMILVRCSRRSISLNVSVLLRGSLHDLHQQNKKLLWHVPLAPAYLAVEPHEHPDRNHSNQPVQIAIR